MHCKLVVRRTASASRPAKIEAAGGKAEVIQLLFETVKEAWRIKELRQRILFTLAMFVVFRAGSAIPVPESIRALAQLFQGDNILAFSTSSAKQPRILPSLRWGLCSYINASIIMNLLTIVIPKFKEWSQEGPEGGKLSQLTRRIVGCPDPGIGLSSLIANRLFWTKASSPFYDYHFSYRGNLFNVDGRADH